MIPADIRPALAKVRNALEGAPHKHRIEFDPYWDWYDKPRLAALAALDMITDYLDDEDLDEDAAPEEATKPPRKK